MKNITSRLFSQSPTRHLLSRTSTGTFECRTITMLAPRPPHASRPPFCAALPPASAACHFFVNGDSTSRLLCAEPAAPTQIDENEHDGPHVFSESQVVITTDTCPIDSRALGVGWAARFGFTCCGPALRVRHTKKQSRGRARAIATTGVLCSPALGESGTYPVVSGGGGGAENQNAPNDTASLSFVENSEAARYVFVVVVICDVMIAGRRYRTFVLAWRRGRREARRSRSSRGLVARTPWRRAQATRRALAREGGRVRASGRGERSTSSAPCCVSCLVRARARHRRRPLIYRRTPRQETRIHEPASGREREREKERRWRRWRYDGDPRPPPAASAA